MFPPVRPSMGFSAPTMGVGDRWRYAIGYGVCTVHDGDSGLHAERAMTRGTTIITVVLLLLVGLAVVSWLLLIVGSRP